MTLPAPTGSPYRIGFVCLGNICRSPMADVILSEMVASAGLGGLGGLVDVASCGTGDWHIGHPMDPRAAAQLESAGYDPSTHRAQQFAASWLDRDLLLAMDAKNLADLTAAGGTSDRVRMFRSFDPLLPADAGPGDLDVPDPYYGAEDGFVEVIGIVERTCRSILAELEALHSDRRR
jgi:protein-tyrosine phosphatase